MLLYFNNNSGAVDARFSFLVDSRALWNMRSVCRSCGLLAWLGRFFLNKEGAGANHSPLHLAVVRRVEPGKDGLPRVCCGVLEISIIIFVRLKISEISGGSRCPNCQKTKAIVTHRNDIPRETVGCFFRAGECKL